MEGLTSPASLVWSWSGNKDADVLACGHSHRYALLSAIGQGLLGPGMRAMVLSQIVSVHREVDDSYWDTVIASIDGRPLAVSWGGNAHNRFLLKPSQPFRLAYGDRVSNETTVETFVPVEAVRAWLLRIVASGLDTLLKRIAGRTRVFVVGSPPPKPEQIVREGLIREPDFVKMAKERGFDIAAAPISSLEVRRAMWSIYQELLLESAMRHGAIFVSVPASAMDHDQCLREELCTPDATHGNAAFGALMWKEIFAAVNRKGR
jgi:hypothetical protein